MEIITTHTNTDMDGLSSMVAAQKLYPDARLVLPGKMSRNVEEFMSLHKDTINIRSLKQIDLKRVKRVIIVDTKSHRRVGKVAEILNQPGVDVHIYDHHPWADGDIRGSLEVVDIVGATVTLLVEKIRESGLPLNSLEATILCLGIYSDTGSLVFTNTTHRDVDAVSFLLQKGANLAVVADFLSRPMTNEQKELLKDLLLNTRQYQVNGAKVLLAMSKTDEYVVGLAVIAHTIAEIEQLDVVFVLAEMEDRVHIVGRSSISQANVADILKHFGGGGHAAAAAAVVKNRVLEDVAEELLTVICSKIQPPICAADIMTSPVKTLAPEMSIAEAGQIMLRYGHTGFPVVKGEKLIGVISRRDVEKAIHHGLGHAPVKGFMTVRVVSVPGNMPVSELQDLMINHDIGRVPVVEAGKIVGIVSRTDILRTLHGEVQTRHRIIYNHHGQEGLSGYNIGLTMERTLLPNVQKILKEAGQIADRMRYKIYAAGGVVRDILLGQESLDVDLVVEGNGILLAEELAKLYDARVRQHQNFGTAEIIFSDDFKIDVATARVEFYAYPAALPQVESSTLHQDLYRRDFTINAMAVALNESSYGNLVDFFDGREDLQEHTVRVLHNLSFIEDPTRILRAIRFEQRYGFKIEPQTLKFLNETVSRGVLSRVSNERIGEELKHIFIEPQAGIMLRRMKELAVWPYIFPRVNYSEVEPVLINLHRALQQISDWGMKVPEPRWLVYLIAILHRSDAEVARAVCEQYVVDKRSTEKLLAAMQGWNLSADVLRQKPQHLKVSQQAQILLQMPWESSPLLLAILNDEESQERFRQLLDIISDSKPKTSGEYIRNLGYRPGPVYREVLDALWREKLDGNLDTEEEEQAFMRDYLARVTKRSE